MIPSLIMMDSMTFRKDSDARLQGSLVCIVTAEIDAIEPAPAALAQALSGLVARRSEEEFPPASIKEPVRAMLRAGGFKPAGRQKPASEYLAQAAREGDRKSVV